MTLAATESEPERIARGLRQKDLALLQALVQEYQYRLVRYFIFLLGTRDQVDDLVQETWLRVLERGRSYDGESRFEPWLFAIARNLAIDHTRKRRLFSLDSNDDDERGECITFAHFHRSLTIRAGGADRRCAASRCIAAITAACRSGSTGPALSRGVVAAGNQPGCRSISFDDIVKNLSRPCGPAATDGRRSPCKLIITNRSAG